MMRAQGRLRGKGGWFAILAAFCGIFFGASCAESPRDARPRIPVESLVDGVSGEAAFSHVEKIVALGPRPPGSKAFEKSRVYLEEELAKLGWATQRQAFKDQTPIGPVEFINLRARFPRDRKQADRIWSDGVKIIAAGHYDTKFYKEFRFVGANDGGSSTGLLVELARVFASDPNLASTVEIVFFDGEEAYKEYTATDGLYGSRYYQKMLRKMPDGKKPLYGVVFDMVGDRDLKLTLPPNSSPDLIKLTYESAAAVGASAFVGMHRTQILDDHVPLANAGLKVVNLIDLDFRPWHTPRDTIDKVSAESLETVGRIGVHLIHALAER